MRSICRVLFPVLFLMACFQTEGVAPKNGRTYDFPIYTNHPPGRQLSGGHAAANTPPLTAEEARKMIQVPAGFEVRLFASEPEVVNPVAMSWDERGRLWVLELYEYPLGAAPGTKGRDRIKILEDTDADGVADKVTVFAEGYSLGTGLELGDGGVYLGAAPNLYFLEDTNGDDKADKETILLNGFGLEDRHELLNGFAWGPDGWLYMTHGVFTHSLVRDPANPGRSGVTMDAALARFDPRTKKFEVFADGTSNPWGVDWNERGEAFVSACVIHHIFHMAPGGQYNRQGGTWANPFGYVHDLPSKGLPSLADWRHYRAAHSGIQVYQGNQYPAAWRGLVMLGNIHQNAINCDRLTPVGATYTAAKESALLGTDRGQHKVGAGNFLVSEDPWFRPVAVKTGPDGVLWVMDWSDRYPCYQNANADPQGVDREYGRIWRVVHVGDEKGKPVPSRPDVKMDLAGLTDGQLVALFDHPNNWHRRQAARLLSQRNPLPWAKDAKEVLLSGKSNGAKARPLASRLAAQWALTAAGSMDHPTLGACAVDSEWEVRLWAARAIGERQDNSAAGLELLRALAGDERVEVRAAVAAALRQLSSGALTVNTPARNPVTTASMLPIFKELLSRPSVAGDTYYPHILWMAMEPRITENAGEFLSLFADTSESSASMYAVYRVMRRISDVPDFAARDRALNTAMAYVGNHVAKTQLAGAALDGLIKAQEAKGAPPSMEMAPVFAKLGVNRDLADKARRLATLYGDSSASKMLVAKLNDPKAGTEERLKAVQAARESNDNISRLALLKLIDNEKTDQAVLAAAIPAVFAIGGDEVAYNIVGSWPRFSPITRRAAAEVLVTRTKSARVLLVGLERKEVKPDDISATARRALARSSEPSIVSLSERLLGRYRASGEDKLKLIAAKRKVVLQGEPDVARGREIAATVCLNCHKLHGDGADVGPDLTGVGRSTLDALLHNVIAPNEIIGNGYETTEVELTDGTTLTGRLVEQTQTRMKLAAAGPVEHAIAKSTIAVANGKPKIRTLDISLMPEGLEQMPDKDFRDLILFLLNPPEDNRPWTPALRRELLGETEVKAPASAQADPDRSDAFRGWGHEAGDGESVALWNPEWKVVCPPFEGAPKKLSDYAGRRNVLMTHPTDRTQPAALERVVDLPAGRGAILEFDVAADARGDWELRVLVNGKQERKQLVTKAGERWNHVSVDLGRYAGSKVSIRLENAPNDWMYEFGYWNDIRLKFPTQAAQTR